MCMLFGGPRKSQFGGTPSFACMLLLPDDDAVACYCALQILEYRRSDHADDVGSACRLTVPDLNVGREYKFELSWRAAQHALRTPTLMARATSSTSTTGGSGAGEHDDWSPWEGLITRRTGKSMVRPCAASLVCGVARWTHTTRRHFNWFDWPCAHDYGCSQRRVVFRRVVVCLFGLHTAVRTRVTG